MKITAAQLIVFFVLYTFIAIASKSAEEIVVNKNVKELIVLVAPLTGDSYYADVADVIFDFHINYALQIKDRDDVLILTDKINYESYAKVLGKDKVALAPMVDIWPRDYALSNPVSPVMFRYTAAAQGGGKKGQRDADVVQGYFAELARAAGLEFKASNLLNDGGNFVDDYAGNVVISRKFLRDNDLTEKQARAKLRELANIKNVAFIDSDDPGGLGHADGVIAFVDTNTLIINNYDNWPRYAHRLRDDLERGLPDVNIHQVEMPYDDSEVYDERFGSACGLYTNALVTLNRIYLPQFGIPQDEIALKQVRAATTREVIPVRTDQICSMGGGVRCMSWQLRGNNADALLKYFQ